MSNVRIACLYLPSFALQVHVRDAPYRAGTAFAIIDGPRDDQGELIAPKRTVLVCSKAAWELGVRPEMSATQARALAPQCEFVPSDPTRYQRALEALGEGLLALSVTVDIGSLQEKKPGSSAPRLRPHQSVYLRVPKRAQGDRFALKLMGQLDKLGYRGRVGIADNRFTAWAAAKIPKKGPKESLFDKDYYTVPIGGSAAFLAPLPLDLLPLNDDIRSMLDTLGIHTLGDFAALPPPSVGRRWNEDGVDFQSLAKGEGPILLQGFSPRDQVIESIEMDHEITDTEALGFSLRPLADRACARLRGRSMAASRGALRLYGRADVCTELNIEPSRPTLDGPRLFELMRAVLQDRRLDHSVLKIELCITEESDPEIEELDLFDPRDRRPSPEAMDVAIARLESLFGNDSVSTPSLNNSHAPERAFELTPFSPPRTSHKRPKSARRKRRRYKVAKGQASLPLVMNGMNGAMRLVDPPQLQNRQLDSITVEGIRSPVVASHGPTKIDAEWWSESPIERDYYEVETEDGGRYWVFRKKSDGRYYLHGIFD